MLYILNLYLLAFILFVLLITSLSVLFANGWPLFIIQGRGYYIVPVWIKVLFFFALLAVIYLGLQRDTYLPFLGQTVLPPTLLKSDAVPENANSQAIVELPSVKDGTKVLYWAANPAKEVVTTPQLAYAEYSNSGITIVKDGKATLKFICPAKYNVGTFNKTLNQHVHYRIVKDNGMLSRINTTWVSCQ